MLKDEMFYNDRCLERFSEYVVLKSLRYRVGKNIIYTQYLFSKTKKPSVVMFLQYFYKDLKMV